MNSLLAIIQQTFRAALREKVVLCMLLMLLLVLGVLPSHLLGDGTAEGRIQLMLRYGLGLSCTLLALTSVWMACAAISGEVQNKVLFLVLSKPVSRMQLWLGKWLGLMLVQALLCAACGVGVYLQVKRIVHNPAFQEQRQPLEQQLVTARERITPDLPDPRIRAAELFALKEERGEVPQNMPKPALLRDLTQYVRITQLAVPPGETVAWTFPLRKPIEEGERLRLRCRLSGTAMLQEKHKGRWLIGASERETAEAFPLELGVGNNVQLQFNAGNALQGAEQIVVRYENLNQTRNMLYLHERTGLNLYRPHSGFGINLLRVMLITWSLLGILAALGLSAGALFSLPVAVYATSFFLLLHACSGLVQDTVEGGSILSGPYEELSPLQKVFDRVGTQVFRGLDLVLAPVKAGIPLEELSDGTAVTWRRVGTQLGAHLLPTLVVVGGLGILGFRRREIGDAS